MKEIKELITSLYNDFLLRDLFAKIVPGMIVIITSLYIMNTEQIYHQISSEIKGVLVFLLVGTSWTVGYAIQQIGEIFKLIIHHPKQYNDSEVRYSFRLKFNKLATKTELQQVERFAVIKEASGNMAISLLFVIIIILFNDLNRIINFSDISFLISIFILLIFSLALIKANRNHAKKQYTFIEKVINIRSEIKVIVFDFDGVIIDSMKTQEEAWKDAIYSVKDELESNQSNGVLNNFWLGKAGKDIFFGLNINPNIEMKLRSKKDEIWNKKKNTIKLFNGADSTLKKLSEHFILAIATTAHRKYVEEHLEKNDIRGLFSMILTNTDVKNPKPSPDLLNSIARTIQISMSSMIMIGDTENDALMAKQAECKFYMFSGNIIENPKPTNVRVLTNWSFLEKELLKEIQNKRYENKPS